MEWFRVLLAIIVCFTNSALCGVEEGKSLKRVKRYITFPEGSAFSFAFCMTIKAVTPDDTDIFSEAVAVATSYDLPNNSMTLGITYPEHAIFGLSRRHRRYVYSRAELVLEKFPENRPQEDEPKDQWVYAGAYKSGILNYNCPDLYPSCPISLVGLLMNLKPTR
ncbi:uncharacterized protein LOC112127813 [Cimex lectularius]|uniref:Secreted protein n=1 Tax=Cimex lectularius TaxID=79782 RepID=A0A8I6SMJ0_CIMLE|nr:uncharacterized protein LOC112127813 [Cimex lectularius]